MLGLMKTREESNPLLANIDVASLPFVDARVKVYPFVDETYQDDSNQESDLVQ